MISIQGYYFVVLLLCKVRTDPFSNRLLPKHEHLITDDYLTARVIRNVAVQCGLKFGPVRENSYLFTCVIHRFDSVDVLWKLLGK